MRIDGHSSYPLDRPARPGGAVAPYRDSQRAVEIQREAPASDAPELPRRPLLRQVEPATASSELQQGYAAARHERAYEQPLSSVAARALASYTSTAMHRDVDANEVLGLDLYA
ncbi:hypothetical protein [Stutzerimonas tarimensis]|uniref:Uncharacterized protein n=1 Tax=Stutzerimonas tarimensis TaxID=1507735 RepID=A0ABV7SZZ2_9GAMM